MAVELLSHLSALNIRHKLTSCLIFDVLCLHDCAHPLPAL